MRENNPPFKKSNSSFWTDVQTGTLSAVFGGLLMLIITYPISQNINRDDTYSNASSSQVTSIHNNLNVVVENNKVSTQGDTILTAQQTNTIDDGANSFHPVVAKDSVATGHLQEQKIVKKKKSYQVENWDEDIPTEYDKNRFLAKEKKKINNYNTSPKNQAIEEVLGYRRVNSQNSNTYIDYNGVLRTVILRPPHK